MTIRVLGCSGSIAAGDRTTAFLLDEAALIDAGTGVGDLTLDELARIDDVLLTHSHLDHVLGVPLLADSVMRRRRGRPPIRVHGLPQTLQALRDHVFNNCIWPDFTTLPQVQAPVLSLHPLSVGQVLTIGTRQVEVLPAAHTVPAVGYAVSGARGTWAFTGDTGPNPALWARVQDLPLCTLVIETAFRDDERAVARVSGHLHPRALADELGHVPVTAEVCITHVKPGEQEAVLREIRALGLPHPVRALCAGDRIALD